MPSGPYADKVGICKNKVKKEGRGYFVICRGQVEEVLGPGNGPRNVIGGPPSVIGYKCTSCGKKYKSETEFDSFAMRVWHNLMKNAKHIELISPEIIVRAVRRAKRMNTRMKK